MAIYRKEVEAIFYTGENMEEIKDFLGEYFRKVDELGKLWYLQSPICGFESWLNPQEDMIVRYSDGSFGDVPKDDFLDEWEEVE